MEVRKLIALERAGRAAVRERVVAEQPAALAVILPLAEQPSQSTPPTAVVAGLAVPTHPLVAVVGRGLRALAEILRLPQPVQPAAMAAWLEVITVVSALPILALAVLAEAVASQEPLPVLSAGKVFLALLVGGAAAPNRMYRLALLAVPEVKPDVALIMPPVVRPAIARTEQMVLSEIAGRLGLPVAAAVVVVVQTQAQQAMVAWGAIPVAAVVVVVPQ